MSHLHTRKEKDCLNCGTIVAGRYCQNCGQQNLDPKESTWHLFVHFFNDVTHFEGSFFSSIKYLLTKPGFLTEEYIKGRRASYLNPIRMYLFISAVFFLLMMSVFKGPSHFIKESPEKADTGIARKSLMKIGDGLDSIDAAVNSDEDGKLVLSDGPERVVVNKKKSGDLQFETVHEYDSAQNALPAAERDGFIERYFSRRFIASQEYYKKNPQEVKRVLWSNYYHSLPYMLFISLPLIALLFKLVYIRRKQFNYVAHGIFTIHFYCFVFIALIVLNTLEMSGRWARLVSPLLQVAGILYLYLAMLRFYKQGKLKTFFKFVIVLGIGTTTIAILALIFIIKSYFSAGSIH